MNSVDFFLICTLFQKRYNTFCIVIQYAGHEDDGEGTERERNRGRAGRRVGAQIGRGQWPARHCWTENLLRTLSPHSRTLRKYSPHRTRRPRSLIVIESRRKARARVSDARPFRDKSQPRKLLSIFTISENFLTRWQKYRRRTTDGKSITTYDRCDANGRNFLCRKDRIEFRTRKQQLHPVARSF